MKILVVDDSSTIRQMIVKQLELAGYENVIQASNGVEAIQNMVGVDLLLTDWKMPMMSGLSLLREVKSHLAYKNVVIIFITSQRQEDDVKQALLSGADDYIVKPFDINVLLEKMQLAEKIVKRRSK